MAAGSMVFNRGTLKLVMALAIPASIAYFFYYAQQEANKDLKDYSKEQKEHPTAKQMDLENYGMKEVDDSNHTHWELVAKNGTIAANGQDVLLKDVTVTFYDQDTRAMKMRLTAPHGIANQTTKFVQLDGEGSRKVLAEGEGGKCNLQCQRVELTKKNQFVATGGVIIEWPGVAKVSGNSASGSTNMAAGPKDIKVVGNTHALIAVK